MPGGESAMSCKAYIDRVLFRLVARLGQCRALRAACPHGLRGAGVPAGWHASSPSCWWLSREWHSCRCHSCALTLPWAGFLGKAALGCPEPLRLPPETRHFSSISTDLGLLWVASVYRLYPLLNNASVLSSYRHDVNVFTQRSLDIYKYGTLSHVFANCYLPEKLAEFITYIFSTLLLFQGNA